MAGIYIHIPFCRSRCIYCGFYSTTGKELLTDRYVDCLIEEMRLRANYLNGGLVSTLYIGGGTPSLLSPHQLSRLKDGILKSQASISQSGKDDVSNMVLQLEEFTVESNPDDVNAEYAEALYKLGVNRVSMGVETFSDDRLRFLRRRHKSSDIERAVSVLRNAGIKNISIDLMFGFPGETVTDWEQDVQRAVDLDVEHISAYSLMYEEGTPLYSMLERGEISPLSEGTSRDMFEKLIYLLESAGYEHYEISNFAKPGFRSIHNSGYWQDVPYIGLGASAHSYNGRERRWNPSDITEYIKSIERGEISFESEAIDNVTHYNDIITTALRTKEGIDLGELEAPFRGYIVKNAEKSMRYGHLIIENGHLHLTRKGIFISDDIMSDLIYG